MVRPPWICQPYVRPPPEVYVKKMADLAAADGLKRQSAEAALPPGGLSKKKLKKLERKPNKTFSAGCSGNDRRCVTCKTNPGGLKCAYELCKPCCKSKCYNLELDCPGHKILVKTKRERARHFEQLQQQQAEAEVQA
jgi:tRNA-dihydrouridine synthase 1